jgi:2,6-dihydroxypyridine 3-monooxygenase
MRVAVVGGSLGGLTAGLLLRDLGYDVTIYERSPTPLEQRGAGIGLMPETSRYLVERAGVDINHISISTSHIRHIDRTGAIVHDHLHAYRFSSWNTIYRQLLASFGASDYRLGHEVMTIAQPDDSNVVSLTLSDCQKIDADLVVVADGIGSRFRESLMPVAQRTYAGYVAWRGMVPEGDLSPSMVSTFSDALTYSVYANSHVLVYPIPGIDGSVMPGERLINFVWYRNYQEGADLDDLLTGVDGATREVSLPPGSVRHEHVAEMKAVAAARLPAVFAAVVEATSAPFIQVVFDVEVPRMVFGRVCLLGDAAWVARPHAAAGTAKAADDGWALAETLDKHADRVPDALKAWETQQMQLGRQLLDRTRRIGAQSQFLNTWRPDDPDHLFGLHAPGSS